MPEIIVGYKPHKTQRLVHNSKKRFKIIVCGRRWGKTTLAINEAIMAAVTKNNSRIFYIAPTYRQAKMVAFNLLKKYAPIALVSGINKMELTFTFVNGSEISLKGADSGGDQLRGVGLDFVILDEFANMDSSVWPEVVRPMLLDSKDSRALFIGTPKGKGHFYDLFITKNKDYESFTFGTIDNPYVSEEEVEALKSEMPERLYQQEIEAKFLDDDSSVFRKIAQCAVGEFKEPVLGRRYVIGADLAKHEDWTVLSVIDSNTLEVVAFERFNQISWPDQKIKILELAHRYNNALVILDSTGVGDAIYDDLQNSRVAVEGFKFTNESKRQLIEKLVISIEQRFIIFPRIPILIDELQRFSYELTAEGKFRYNAPEGFHDDCVISLALANWAVRSEHYPVRQLQKLATEDPIDKQGQGQRVDYEYQFQENISGY